MHPIKKQNTVSSFYPKVNLEAYNGPLDLLLTLIKKNKINIYDIPIVEITNQYLEAIGLDEKNGFLIQEEGTAENTNADTNTGVLNLDAGGDFIVMAAQLIYIKSVMLLPKRHDENSEDEGEDIEDPRAELTDMLLEYKKVKEVAEFLNNRPILGRDVFGVKIIKSYIDDDEYKDENGNIIIQNHKNNKVVFEANIFILSKYFYDKIKEAQNRISVYEVDRENFSVKEKIIEIMEKFGSNIYYFENFNASDNTGVIAHANKITFGIIVKNSRTKDEFFTYFLAVLEMARLLLITADQFQFFGDIYITPVSGSLDTYRSKIASMN
ncbi:MAG: segregation and condensation protein A [Candidatus Acidulodesulfobacterium sp.]